MERKPWTVEEPTTPHTRKAIGRLAAEALARIESLSPRDEAQAALYLSAPFPAALDRAVRPLVDGLRVLEPDEREPLRDQRLSRAQLQALALFAERMAYLAVRKRDEALILDGLIALGVGWPLANSLLRIAGKLHQAALELGVDPTAPFARAARLARRETAALLETFAT
jgi:hypothetical protein